MGRSGRNPFLVFAALLMVAGSDAAAADSAASSQIGGSFFDGAEGALAVNASAGDLNQQFNGATITRNASDSSVTSVRADQGSGPIGEGPNVGLSSITGQAFRDVAGLIRVNQASGVGNLQANGVTIAIGVDPSVASDVTLRQTRAPVELPPGAGTVTGALNSVVSPTAFQDAQGIVQVNQAAGSGNASANALALRFQGGAIQ